MGKRLRRQTAQVDQRTVAGLGVALACVPGRQAADGALEQRDVVALKQSPRFLDLFVVRFRGDFDPAREQLGELTDLEPAFGQRLQELVLLLRVRVEARLAGVEEFGRALQRELEARLREIAVLGFRLHVVPSGGVAGPGRPDAELSAASGIRLSDEWVEGAPDSRNLAPADVVRRRGACACRLGRPDEGHENLLDRNTTHELAQD